MSQGTGFWADSVTEPKRSFRWILNIDGIDQWIVKEVAKPVMTIKPSKHSFLNYEFKFPGRVEYSDIDVTLVDPVQPDATATIVTLLRAGGYVYPNDVDQENPITISKQKAVAALGNQVLIKQLDADGVGFIEAWKLYNPWITKADFGKLKYEGDDLVDIKITITYDWAELNPVRDNRLGVLPDRGLPSAAAQNIFNRSFGLS